MIERRTRTRAEKARAKIDKMIAEQTAWTGKKPTVVRVETADLLALVECRYVVDGRLSGTDLEVRPG